MSPVADNTAPEFGFAEWRDLACCHLGIAPRGLFKNCVGSDGGGHTIEQCARQLEAGAFWQFHSLALNFGCRTHDGTVACFIGRSKWIMRTEDGEEILNFKLWILDFGLQESFARRSGARSFIQNSKFKIAAEPEVGNQVSDH